MARWLALFAARFFFWALGDVWSFFRDSGEVKRCTAFLLFVMDVIASYLYNHPKLCSTILRVSIIPQFAFSFHSSSITLAFLSAPSSHQRAADPSHSAVVGKVAGNDGDLIALTSVEVCEEALGRWRRLPCDLPHDGGVGWFRGALM